MLMRLFRRGLPLCLFFVCLALSVCLERRLPEGVMASVNGEPIHLAAVQALMDSRSTSLGIPLRPSLEDMKNRYGGALGTLIVHTLVRQDLARRGLSVTDAALEHAVEQVRADFGPGGLEKFLTDSSLREADWKALMRDYLAMDVFRKRVLLPAIQVSLEEARAYYQEHKAEFLLPGSLDVCLATAPDREALTAYCGSFAARFRPRPGDAAQAGFPSLAAEATTDSDALAQCMEVRPDEVPPAWRKELETLTPGSCGQPRQQEGEWRVVALAGRHRGHALDLAEAYPLIEALLLEEKKSAAFGKWLEDSLARSTILVAPELREPLLNPGPPGYAAMEPDESEELERSGEQQAGGAPSVAPDAAGGAAASGR